MKFLLLSPAARIATIVELALIVKLVLEERIFKKVLVLPTLIPADSSYYFQDLLEGEYKPKPTSGYCASILAKTCTVADELVCQTPATYTYCIRNAFFYGGDCYGSCPQSTFQSSFECQSCSANCKVCTSASACTTCSEGYILNGAGACQTTSCGNGIVEAPETCDDLNQIDGDGCSKYCLIEDGFICTLQQAQGPSICTPICGDGKFFGISGEECDDHNFTPGDGCDSECKIEANWWCEGGSPTTKSVCHCSPKHISNYNSYSNSYMTITFKFSLDISSMVSVSNSTLFL